MVPLMSLWAPILVAAVLVFIASSVIHMFLGYHRSDVRKVGAEDDLMEAVRKAGLAPGDYLVPHAGSREGMKAPEFVAKVAKGPMVIFTVLPGGSLSMGKNLAQWFVYCVVVGVFAAYVAGRALPSGAEYLHVFRFAGATAFAGYSLALLQGSIWYGRSWGYTLKSMFDGLVYAALTGGAFGWLWP